MKQKFWMGVAMILITAWFGFQVKAQDLPYQPVLSAEQGYIPTDKLAWSVDSTTLIFEVQADKFIASDTNQGYEYDAVAGELHKLDDLPFSLNLTPEQADYFQTGETVQRSPYGTDHFPILYGTGMVIHCGNECSGYVNMIGSFCNVPAECGTMWGFNRPLQIVSLSGLRIRWNRDNNAAVVFTESDYGCATNITYLGAGGEYYVASVDCEEPPYTNAFFDFSSDGKRILYNRPGDNPTQNALMLWEIETLSSENTNLVTRNSQVVKVADITGAGFSPKDEYQIVYVDDAGIVQYSLWNGETQIVNADINSTWVNYGLFSPDNRYIAVLSLNQLYVVPTGIDKP